MKYARVNWVIIHNNWIQTIKFNGQQGMSHRALLLSGLIKCESFLSHDVICNCELVMWKQLKWFVDLAAACLNIHKEPSMFNAHAVRLSILCQKVSLFSSFIQLSHSLILSFLLPKNVIAFLTFFFISCFQFIKPCSACYVIYVLVMGY